MIWPFHRRRCGAAMVPRWDLSAPILSWSREDLWTIRDALAGTLVLGATGAGKSSGSGALIATSMLSAGFGGLVLVAKPDERALWERYCCEAGRADDLVVFRPGSGLCFNPLDHELQHGGADAGLTENIVQLFAAIMEVAERGAAGGGGREDEGYWRRACRQLLRNVVDLLAIAKGRVSIPDIYKVVVSAATSFEQLRSEQWRAESYCYQLLREADRQPKSDARRRDFQMVTDYLCLEFPGLSDKTRSVVVSTLTSMVDVLNRGVLRELFCGETTITPEVVEDGKILLIELPVKGFAEIGQFANVLWKHAFQRSIERRVVSDSTRPVFLWADEAQYFVTSYDMQFATTCRSARVATVLLTQNVSNFEAALGGNEKGKAETASLFANLNTKIFHANGDPVTNQWAATLIGRNRQNFINSSTSQRTQDWVSSAFGMTQDGQQSAGFSEQYEFEVQPTEFTTLRTGGPENGWNVDGVLFQNGRRFRRTGRTWMPVRFQQER